MSRQAVTPLYLQMALFYYSAPNGSNFLSSNPFRISDPDVVSKTHQQLVDENMLRCVESKDGSSRYYCGTYGLDYFVKQLCQIPRPQSMWLTAEEQDYIHQARTATSGDWVLPLPKKPE